MNERQRKILTRISWDYSITPEELYAVIKGDRAVAGHGDAEKLLIRLLETLNWYDLLGLFSPEELAQKLVGPTIRGIYPP